MFERASLKLGLDQAVLSLNTGLDEEDPAGGEEDGEAKSLSTLGRKEIDNLLR